MYTIYEIIKDAEGNAPEEIPAIGTHEFIGGGKIRKPILSAIRKCVAENGHCHVTVGFDAEVNPVTFRIE